MQGIGGRGGVILTLACLVSALLGAEPPAGRVSSAKVKLSTPKKGDDKRAGDRNPVPFSIFVPDEVKVVRGVVFNPFYEKTVAQEHWRTAAAHWDFALMGADLFGVRKSDFAEVVSAGLVAMAGKAAGAAGGGGALGDRGAMGAEARVCQGQQPDPAILRCGDCEALSGGSDSGDGNPDPRALSRPGGVVRRQGRMGGRPPAIDYLGPKNWPSFKVEEACWFSGQSVAWTWRAFVARERKVRISAPPGLGDGQPFVLHDAGDAVELEVSVSKDLPLLNLSLYLGGTRVAKGDADARILSSGPLTEGIHTLTVVGWSEDGRRHYSQPHTILVR